MQIDYPCLTSNAFAVMCVCSFCPSGMCSRVCILCACTCLCGRCLQCVMSSLFHSFCSGMCLSSGETAQPCSTCVLPLVHSHAVLSCFFSPAYSCPRPLFLRDLSLVLPLSLSCLFRLLPRTSHVVCRLSADHASALHKMLSPV